MSLEAGAHVDRYVLVALLGEGGQGAVWKAEDRLDGSMKALKLVHRRLAKGNDLERLREEARLLARLEHPSLCRVHGLFEDLQHEVVGVAMDFVAGRSLADALEEPRLNGSLRERALLHVAAALAYVHQQGAVHRDVKLGNVVVDEAFFDHPDEPAHIKLVDFRIAALDGARQRLTDTGHAVGTPAYMAPELIDPSHWALEEAKASAADVFALGVMAWRLLVGGHPTGVNEGDGLGAYVLAYRRLHDEGTWPPRMPGRGPSNVVRKCLALYPEDRLVDGAAVVRQLRGKQVAAKETTDIRGQVPTGATAAHSEPRSRPTPSIPQPARQEPPVVLRTKPEAARVEPRRKGKLVYRLLWALVGVLGLVAIVLAWPLFAGEDEPFEAVPFEAPDDERETQPKKVPPAPAPTARSVSSPAPYPIPPCNKCPMHRSCEGDCDAVLAADERFRLRLYGVFWQPVPGVNETKGKHGITVTVCTRGRCTDVSDGRSSVEVTAGELMTTGVDIRIDEGPRRLVRWSHAGHAKLVREKLCKGLTFVFWGAPDYIAQPELVADKSLRYMAFYLDPPSGEVPARCKDAVKHLP